MYLDFGEAIILADHDEFIPAGKTLPGTNSYIGPETIRTRRNDWNYDLWPIFIIGCSAIKLLLPSLKNGEPNLLDVAGQNKVFDDNKEFFDDFDVRSSSIDIEIITHPILYFVISIGLHCSKLQS